MEYVLVTLPFWAFVGVVGALISVLRGRTRLAIGFGLVGVSAMVLAVALYYLSV